MPPPTSLGIHQPANTGDEAMIHRHYDALGGQWLGFNPSAESHDLLLGRTICIAINQKIKGGERGRAGWNGRQQQFPLPGGR